MHYETEDILLYLNGGMTAGAKEAFEAACTADRDLKARLDTCRDMMAFLQRQQSYSDETEQLRRTTAELNRQYFSPEEKPATRSINLRIFRNIAAAAAGIVLILFAALQLAGPADPLDKYGHIQATTPTERGADGDEQKSRLVTLINKHQYTAALPLAKEVLSRDSSKATSRLYYGLCLLHTGQEQDARYWLIKVYEGPSLLRYRAALLTAISYQQQQQEDSCRSWLRRIPASAEEYAQAQQLAASLK